jgi:hypothetical protein
MKSSRIKNKYMACSNINRVNKFSPDIIVKNIPQEKLSQEKLSQEKLSQKKLSQGKLSQEKLSQEKLSQEKLSQEKLSQEKLSQEKLSQETVPCVVVEPKVSINMVGRYMKQLVRSEIDMTNSNLRRSMDLLQKGAFYYPHYVCEEKDTTIFENIIKELEMVDEFKVVEWSKHYKIDNPKFSETFNKIIDDVSKVFNVTVLETRLNYYKNKNDWKPLHHDSHAYSDGIREDFTIGISFGASRELVFMHEESGNTFKFPQKNGDIFAFDHNVNKDFMHGITKSLQMVGPRISLIAWGKRCDR